jgi:hypothetical protein
MSLGVVARSPRDEATHGAASPPSRVRRREETTATFVILAHARIQDATRPIQLARVVSYTTLSGGARGILDSGVRGNDIET